MLHLDAERIGYLRRLAAVHYLLMDQVRSDLGFITGEIPEKPDVCDYDEMSEYHEAMEDWRVQVCAIGRITSREDLDEWITTGTSGEPSGRSSREQELLARVAAVQAASLGPQEA